MPSASSDGASWIGRYEVRGEIGRGAMGVVVRAWDPAMKREVAIKLVRAGAELDAASLERFQREASATARLRHPGIIGVHDVGRQGPDAYIVMDFIEGETFAARLARRPPRAEILALVHAIANALGEAHGAGIVHRDVKPANVLIDARGRPILTDFGFALDTAAQSRLTPTGVILGTPRFMAPEQVDGQKDAIGPAVDVWALGAILYEALTGQVPFPAKSVVEVFRKILDEDPTPPRAIDPSIPVELEELILRCLDREPTARPSAADVSQALARVRATSDDAIRRASARAALAKTGAAVVVVVAVAIVLAVVVGVVLAVALRRAG